MLDLWQTRQNGTPRVCVDSPDEKLETISQFCRGSGLKGERNGSASNVLPRPSSFAESVRSASNLLPRPSSYAESVTPSFVSAIAPDRLPLAVPPPDEFLQETFR